MCGSIPTWQGHHFATRRGLSWQRVRAPCKTGLEQAQWAALRGEVDGVHSSLEQAWHGSGQYFELENPQRHAMPSRLRALPAGGRPVARNLSPLQPGLGLYQAAAALARVMEAFRIGKS